MTPFVRNSLPYRVFDFFRSYSQWKRRGFASPSPHAIKQAILLRNGFADGTWVETGTYLGQTTELLSKNGKQVFSIEPEPTLFSNASTYFKSFSNVKIIEGTSEEIFPTLLPQLSGSVNFWLDGHYSAGVTFKGKQDTPVLDEMKVIEENKHRFRNLCVLIDDVRCFNPNLPEYATYPHVEELIAWAKRNDLNWHIEHDIFCAKSRN